MSGSRRSGKRSSGAGRVFSLVAIGFTGFSLAATGVGLLRIGRLRTALPAPAAAVASQLPTPPPVSAPTDPLPVAQESPQTPPSSALAAPAHDAGAGLTTTAGVIHPGGSLANALSAKGVPVTTVYRITRELDRVFDFRGAKAGDDWRLVSDDAADLVHFQYSTADLVSYHVYRQGEGYVAERREPEILRTAARIAGVVDSSLYESIRDLGESPQLASDFAEIFAWDVDFSRTVQRGDGFSILYERLYRSSRDGVQEYVGPGMILAAHYEGQTGEHEAVYFESDETRGGYYRPDGSSVQRQFLVAPLKYSRISSSFTHSRLHPILKITRPHHGIDYAAPAGTPIFAVAEGQVMDRGWSSGYGRLVKIRHSNGFVSYYAHMSRYADGLQVGDTVQQKQVIGYVGQTGLATGPHVCFRISKDGRFVNPAALKTPGGDPIPPELIPEFSLVRDALFTQLQGAPLVATDEAL